MIRAFGTSALMAAGVMIVAGLGPAGIPVWLGGGLIGASCAWLAQERQ